ncbi:MAG: RNA polymerase-binding protein DksA [Aquabacterium sp.]|nr:RNA polymerase-binding protein DksA [Aquabacterium sp.]
MTKPSAPSTKSTPDATVKPAKPSPTSAGKATKKKAVEGPVTSSTPDNTPHQAPAILAETVIQAKSVAPGRSTSKTSTPDNMPTPATKVDPKIANAWKTKSGRELTQAELMAMPEAEYMSDKQLDFFRACLEVQRDDLLSNAGETTEHLREDTSIVPDPADRATIEEEHALELRTRDRERKLLKKISQALTRLDSGEYGFCDETGEPIGLGRLLARPTATLSLEAQQRRELKQKMFGD